MASAQQVLLSPAELAYLHSTLSLTPPIRPDGRKANQFRPLTAETGILPGTNGSARVCFADGTEAIVGAKAEIEKTPSPFGSEGDSEETKKLREAGEEARGRNDWLEIAVEIPGSRDDDAATVFLANMLSEALLADGEFSKKLRINNRFHWKLYLDSEGDEDPMFDDDWEASTFLYPRDGGGVSTTRPPITLLVIAVGGNIIFDPAREELAVAESALAVELKLLAVRTVDPPSRLTAPGELNSNNPATGLAGTPSMQPPTPPPADGQAAEGVWKPPIGGTKLNVLEAMIAKVLEKGGIVDEVLDGVAGVDLS
uniref:Ribosomal RNA-processing protein 42 n=1 Tax=Colletotrichum fructicola (strain Nara gc5) TaxID=1213859 RepID=L2G865_COLFN